MRTTTTRLILIGGSLVVFVLLIMAPRVKPAEEIVQAAERPEISPDANLEVFFNLAEKSLEPAKKQELSRLMKEQKQDSAAQFWDRLKRPDLASYHSEKLAERTNLAADWFKAGNRYYYAVQFTQDKSESPVLFQSAMRCFSKGLAIEPRNTDARIMLAACYVEGGADPMEGIRQLREIEKTDSANVKLQMTFALFSLKSRQYDKAILRFKKVLAADSNFIEAYLHLADAYEQLGERDNTVDALKKYAARTSDVTARLEIEKYIQQLK